MSEFINLQHGQYKIPLKFKKQKHLSYFKKAGEIEEESATEEVYTTQLPQKTRPNTYQRYYNIENVKNALEVLNENYDTFRTIFKAPDDINVNYEIQQEAAGLIIDLFNPKIISNPVRVKHAKESGKIHQINRKLKGAPWSKTYSDYRNGEVAEGFDEEEFVKHRGCWNKKNIEEFKELFDD
jgi:hypothetical protein